jgi:hypothetical protein
MSDITDNVKKLFCPACGSENKTGNTFCMNCGERLQPLTEEKEVHSEVTNPYEPAVSEPEVSEPAQEVTPSAPPNTQQSTPPRADAEVVSSTPWYAEGNNQNPYNNTGSTYSPPPTYGPGNNTINQPAQGSQGLAIASLVCGILSIICCWIGFLISFGGLITGIMAITKKENGRGMAIAGTVMSAIGLALWGILGLALIITEAMPNTLYW